MYKNKNYKFVLFCSREFIATKRTILSTQLLNLLRHVHSRISRTYDGIRVRSSFLDILLTVPEAIAIDMMHVGLLGPLKKCFMDIVALK